MMEEDIKIFFGSFNHLGKPSGLTSYVDERQVNSALGSDSNDSHSSQKGKEDDDSSWSESPSSKRKYCLSMPEKKKILDESSKPVTHRSQNYRKEWENDEMFSSWISPAEESTRKAQCRLCNTTLLSEITVLKRHLLSRKHIERVKDFNIGSKSSSVTCGQDNFAYQSISNKKLAKKKISVHRNQNYSKAWENNEKFGSWIGPSEDSKRKSLCKICNETMKADLDVLKKHAISQNHTDLQKDSSLGSKYTSIESSRESIESSNVDKTYENDKMAEELYSYIVISPESFLDSNNDDKIHENAMPAELYISTARCEKSSKRQVHRAQNYRKQWENDELFAGWIGPSKESRKKAMCRLCNRTMLAEHTVIKRHASSWKHIRNMKDERTGTINPSTDCSLELSVAQKNDEKRHGTNHISEESKISFKTHQNSYDITTELNISSQSSQKSSRRQVQRNQNYRIEWENDEIFASWIAPSKESKTKAMCRPCNKTLLAEIMVLKRHALSQKHIQVMKVASLHPKNLDIDCSFKSSSESSEAENTHENNESIEDLNTGTSLVIQESNFDQNNGDKTHGINKMDEDSNTSLFSSLESFVDPSEAGQTYKNNGMAKNSGELQSQKRRGECIKKHRNPNYRIEWENDERFANWISPVIECKTKALCRLCNTMILADCTVLRRHASSQKHMKILNDLNTSQNISLACIIGMSPESSDPSKARKDNEELKISQTSIGQSVKKNVHYYRKGWEYDEAFAGWIGPTEDCKTKAMCRLCFTTMLAETSVLKKHAMTRKHIELAKVCTGSTNIYVCSSLLNVGDVDKPHENNKMELEFSAASSLLNFSKIHQESHKKEDHKVLGHKAPRYRKKWECNEILASWIGPSEESNSRAMCRICNTTMLADLTVLKRHPFSRKHIQILKDLSQWANIFSEDTSVDCSLESFVDWSNFDITYESNEVTADTKNSVPSSQNSHVEKTIN